MDFKKQSYKANEFRITFTEPDWYALDCYKNGEPYYLALAIDIKKKHENGKEQKYGYYFREFEKQPNIAHVTRFIDKFLADPEYRKQFFVDGEHWTGVLTQTKDEKSPVNPRCAAAIKRLNAKKEKDLRFKDFASLKSYGIDGFSRMKEDTLKEHISQKAVSTIDDSLEEDLRLSAYRWAARGLSPEFAIRKVKTDAEIAANARLTVAIEGM